MMPTTTSIYWADIAARGVAQPFQVCEDEEGRVPYSEQPEHTATASEEQDALLPLEGRSGPFDDHEQVDIAMKAAQDRSEVLSIPTHLVLDPPANANMEDGGTILERGDVAVPRYNTRKTVISRGHPDGTG
jgi:hypothetical protein